MSKIVIYTPPSNFHWGHPNADVGGSELWAEVMAVELAKEHEVILVCSTGGKRFFRRALLVCDHSHSEIYQECDTLICSRTSEPLKRVKAEKKYMVYHDVVTQRNWEFFPNLQGMMYPGLGDEIDGYVFVSKWQRDFIQATAAMLGGFDLIGPKAHVIPNGHYPERFAEKREKKNQIIFSSNPERGLQLLLELFPRIHEETGAELKVCYGMDFYRSHSGAVNESWISYIEGMLDQDGVTYMGHLSQDELAKEYLESKVWVYPSNFPETFCITALEAMAGRCNCVATAQAALTDTLDMADLITAPAGTNEYNDTLVGLIEKALAEPEKDYSEHLSKFTWDEVVRKWRELI